MINNNKQQENKQIIIISKMIHTYSPNWYKPQCLFFLDNYLFYASNYVLYRYNLQKRKVENDKCFRKIAMANGMNSKDIKIHTICKLSQQLLIVGTNQPHAVVLRANDFQVISIVKNMGISQAFLCFTQYCQSLQCYSAIFCDQNGSIVKLSINIQNTKDYKLSPINGQNTNKQKIKEIVKMGKLNLVVSGKGHITVFDNHFQAVLQSVQATKIGLDQQYVLSLDTWEDTETTWVCMLTRSKNNNTYIHWWALRVGQQMSEQPIQLQFKQLLKSQIKVLYPKSLNDKLKNAQKAAMVIKFINSKFIILTGKLGQMFILNLQKCPQAIIIKPHSIQEMPQYLQILNDSKHYRQIYGIYSHIRKQQKSQQIYTVSTDQTMNVWSAHQNTLNSLYSIKYVTSQLVSIFHSEADPKNIFFLLKDSIIRSVAPLSNQNYFLNQYWKYTKKFKVTKAVLHLTEPGITAMVTQQKKIIIYDLFDDRLVKIIELKGQNANEQIINITYEYNTILQPIKQITNVQQNQGTCQWNPTQVKINKLYVKNIKNAQSIGLLIQQKSRFVYIHEVKENQEECLSIKRICRIQRIHNTKLWDGNSLLMTQNKNMNLKAILYWKSKIIKLEANLKIGGRCIFKLNESLLTMLEHKTKKICIYEFQIQKELQNVSTHNLELPLFVEQVVLDSNKCQAIFYNGKDDAFALVKFGKVEPKVYFYEVGNKIQNLSFYLSEYVVIGFKDQSLKLLQFSKLVEFKDQPQKKVKKSLQNSQKNNEMVQEKQKLVMDMNE